MTHEFRIARVQRTLRRLEDDVPLLNMRVKELSKERQDQARSFAAAVIAQARAELEKLMKQRPVDAIELSKTPSEPGD